jgi:hypothetical protein
LLAVSDRTWGQTPVELPTLVFSIEENSPAGTEVGALAELYPELNHFRFSNRSRTTLFQVHPDTGVVSVRDGARLDFEKRPVVTLTIVADIREEQEDPYLAEFADSLRDEGFSSRTLSRLIPLEQRIQVQVQLRDVKEADEQAIAADADVRAESAGAADESTVAPVAEPSSSEVTFVPAPGDPNATDPAMSENGSPDKATGKIQTPANELYPPATQRLTPESTASVEQVRVPEIVAPVISLDLRDADATEGPDETAVPMPSDVPPVAEESSTGNGKTLTLSETSGEASLRLNGANGERAGNSVPDSAAAAADQAMIDAEMEAAEVAVHPQRTFLLRGFVSLMIVLGTAYLLRHRWKSFRKSLPEPQEEQAAEASASNEPDTLTANVSSDDQAEMKAADEFVKELFPEESAPQIEHAIKAVITQRPEEDDGAPFDPESLIDDEYFNDADDLRLLKARNAELGDRLEALAGAVESAPADPLRIDDLLAATSASSGSVLAVQDDKRPETSDDNSSDSDSDFIERSNREDRSEFTRGRGSFSTFDQDAAPLAEPRWNSDWPGYSEGTSPVSVVPSAETVASLAAEPKCSEVMETTDDKIASLRNELADLFAMQKKAEVPEAKPIIPAQSQRDDIEESCATDETAGKPEPCPEETHLESVAQYLSQLLERSKKEEAADAIFVDRRKSSDKPAGKWDGVDRRGGAPKAKAPVKSYIESYLSEHGGELSHDSGQQRNSEVPSDESSQPSEPKPLVERRPVDVQAIRQHMNSFRNVASTALEHALASHRIRQAKGKVAGRTTLVVGLTVVSVLAIATNSAMKIYFPSLGWLMGLIICLVIAELILRIEAIRRHRRELRYRILEPVKKPVDRSDRNIADGTVAVQDVSQTLS